MRLSKRKIHLKKIIVIATVISLMLLPSPAYGLGNQYFNSLYDHDVPPGILDHTPTIFVVTGYSTSSWPDAVNNWPAVLQKMLNQHAGDTNTYKVYNEAKGGTPIAKWTKICASDSVSLNVINKYKNTTSRKIMLGQQSTQWAIGDCSSDGRFVEIEVHPGETPDGNDQARIQKGADAINYFANLWLENNFDLVYIGTHIYTDPMGCCFNKTNSFPWYLYGERFAMIQALNQGSPNLYPGAETWEITRALYPEPFASEADICGFHTDGRHPVKRATHAMALYWYTVLAGSNAKPQVMQPIADVAGVPLPKSNEPIPGKGAYCNGGVLPSTSPTASGGRASPISTPPASQVDFDQDGDVDTIDQVELINGFANTYDIFDYNLLTQNFGKYN